MSNKAAMATNSGEVQDTLVHGVDKATIGAHSAVDKASGVATNAANSVGHKVDDLNVAGAKFMDRASDYMRDNPLASLGIAVATGYLLSRLISR